MLGSCHKWHNSLVLGHASFSDINIERRRIAMGRMIGILIFPDFQLLDAAGPISVFEVAGRFARQRTVIKPLALDAGLVRSSSGVEMMAHGIEDVRALDILIVAGGEGISKAMLSEPTLTFLKTSARRVRRISSVCSGAYVLASAVLLDGRRATTHCGRTADFLAAFPKVRLEPDRIFVKDDNVLTS